MIRVLFVCLGNICRSPMAEFIMKSIISERGLSDRFYIASAATSTEEIWNGVGNPVYPPAKRELAKHGISCEGKRAVQITKADYGKYDYILDGRAQYPKYPADCRKGPGAQSKAFAGLFRSSQRHCRSLVYREL